MQPTSPTVFRVYTDTLLLRVTALLLRVTAPITPRGSPIIPSLGPPRLGPTVRSLTTEVLQMVFDYSNSWQYHTDEQNDVTS